MDDDEKELFFCVCEFYTQLLYGTGIFAYMETQGIFQPFMEVNIFQLDGSIYGIF